MSLPVLQINLPGWVEEYLARHGRDPVTALDRMRMVIELARLNVDNRTGGPFAAAVFDIENAKLISVGVNLVVQQNCSMAHAEMVAISLAQQVVGHHSLANLGRKTELVTSVEPCAMCLGAIPWSGVYRVVCGARDEDATEIGFNEGLKPSGGILRLEDQGIAVIRDVLRDQARTVLELYKDIGGEIY